MAGHALPLMSVTTLHATLARRGTNIFNSSNDLYYEAAGWLVTVEFSSCVCVACVWVIHTTAPLLPSHARRFSRLLSEKLDDIKKEQRQVGWVMSVNVG